MVISPTFYNAHVLVYYVHIKNHTEQVKEELNKAVYDNAQLAKGTK